MKQPKQLSEEEFKEVKLGYLSEISEIKSIMERIPEDHVIDRLSFEQRLRVVENKLNVLELRMKRKPPSQ
jgi:hypothetical protein